MRRKKFIEVTQIKENKGERDKIEIMEQAEVENESTDAREAFIYLVFQNDEGEEIQKFGGINLPLPNQGEKLYLTNVDYKDENKENEEADVHSQDFYKVDEVVKLTSI